jgi:hypothetical protein
LISSPTDAAPVVSAIESLSCAIPTCAEPHLASQDRVDVVVTHDGTRESVAESHGQRHTFKELQLAPDPDNPARCEINPVGTSDVGCHDRDRGGSRLGLDLTN